MDTSVMETAARHPVALKTAGPDMALLTLVGESASRAPRAGRSIGAATTRRTAGPVGPPRSGVATAQLQHARRCLADAMATAAPDERFAAAHRAALHAASSVLASRPRPTSRTLRNASAWVLLQVVAPELADWAVFFAAGSSTRAAAEAGLSRQIGSEQADRMVTEAGRFIDVSAGLVRGVAA